LIIFEIMEQEVKKYYVSKKTAFRLLFGVFFLGLVTIGIYRNLGFGWVFILIIIGILFLAGVLLYSVCRIYLKPILTISSEGLYSLEISSVIIPWTVLYDCRLAQVMNQHYLILQIDPEFLNKDKRTPFQLKRKAFLNKHFGLTGNQYGYASVTNLDTEPILILNEVSKRIAIYQTNRYF
jgi:hypothetical protein